MRQRFLTNEAWTNGHFVIFNDIVPVNEVARYSEVRPVCFAKLKRNLKSKTCLKLVFCSKAFDFTYLTSCINSHKLDQIVLTVLLMIRL